MKTTILGTALLCLCVAFTACGGDDDDGDGAGGTGGTGGSAGKGGSSGKGGGAGKGSGGSAGKGTGGSAGKGSGGSGGSAGAEENGGAAGDDTNGSGGVDAVGGQGGADNTSGAGGEAGAGAGAGGQPGATIELRGRWTSDFGEEIIDNDAWAGTELIEFSNDENIAITRNAADAEYNPSKFNRIVWTEVSMASFFYCTSDYGLDSLVAARTADGPADDSDPEAGGCGTNNFTWTKLTSNDIEIYGTWTNQSGGTEKIDALTWTTTFGDDVTVSKVIEFSNVDKEVITQNPADAASGPSKFNRIVWTSLDGFLYYCTTDFNLDTLEDAQDADTAADATDPATNGCGGSPWTQLTYTP